MFFKLLVASILLLLHNSQCARILGYFMVPSISHQVAFQPIWRELALRGHQVTVISPNILGENIENLTEIDVGHAYEVFNRKEITENFGKQIGPFEMMSRGMEMMKDVVEDEWNNPEVNKLIKRNETEFDIILVEALNPLVYSWAAKYRVPVVGICSLGAPLYGHDSVGNPTHPVITPEFVFDIRGDATFWERLDSFIYNIRFRFAYNYYWLPFFDKFARTYFGEDMPYLGDLERNVSLLLLNVNPLMHPIRPNVPAIVEISQMHIKSKKHLREDIKNYLDNAKEGFVYFSLGSNVKSVNLAPEVRQVILQALGDLPYKVLWKWETDHLPGQPKNVKIAKWLAQQEVLAHPNIKAFVTQGGIQSIEEALSHGVPMVGIPFIADQPLNVFKLAENGVAKYVDFATMTREQLKADIIEVATNRKYKENALKLKRLLTDVPMTGLEKAVWWIEYVLRNNGASHLVSPTRDMPYWKYFCLDVIGFLTFVTSVSVYILYKILRKVIVLNSHSKIKVS